MHLRIIRRQYSDPLDPEDSSSSWLMVIRFGGINRFSENYLGVSVSIIYHLFFAEFQKRLITQIGGDGRGGGGRGGPGPRNVKS